MAFDSKTRLAAYSAILTKPDGINPEDLLNLNDMITSDLGAYEAESAEKDKLTTDNQSLRDTNHKLFLKVTGGQPATTVETPVLSPDESALDAFQQLIKDGVL